MSDCSRCKAALELDGRENATSLLPQLASSSGQVGPTSSSTRLTRSAKASVSNTGQDQLARSSKQAPSASQPKSLSASQPKLSSKSQPKSLSTSKRKPSSSTTAIVGSTSSTRGSSNRSGGITQGPTTDTGGRLLSHSSKQNTADAVSSLPGSLSAQLTFTSPALDFRPTSIKPKAHPEPNKAPFWVAPADKMLGEVPTGWAWHASLVQVDKSLLAAVATNTAALPDGEIGGVGDTQNKDRLLKLVQGFAHRHSVQRVNFQQFLLVCLCTVLNAQNFLQSSIMETLQICIMDAGEGNMIRYLKGVKWANKLLNRLFFAGWGHRAIDIMVICTCGRNWLQGMG